MKLLVRVCRSLRCRMWVTVHLVLSIVNRPAIDRLALPVVVCQLSSTNHCPPSNLSLSTRPLPTEHRKLSISHCKVQLSSTNHRTLLTCHQPADAVYCCLPTTHPTIRHTPPTFHRPPTTVHCPLSTNHCPLSAPPCPISFVVSRQTARSDPCVLSVAPCGKPASMCRRDGSGHARSCACPQSR